MNRRSFLSASAAAMAGMPNATAQKTTAMSSSMRLGCVTYNLLKDWDVDTIIQKLQSAGLDAVELRTGHKHGVEPSLGPEERKRVRQRFEASRVRLLSYGTTTRFQAADAGHVRMSVNVFEVTIVDLQTLNLCRDTPHANARTVLVLQLEGITSRIGRKRTRKAKAKCLRQRRR